MAACPVMACLLCAVQSTAHNTTPSHNKLRCNLTECFNINITLARLNCKLPDDGSRTKNMQEPSNFNVNCNQSFNKCASVGE